MFRLWAKIFKDNKLIKDVVICNDTKASRTHKVFDAIDKITQEFDLAKPIWLNTTVNEFKKHSKVKFTKDCFVEEIDFDYLEIHIIEED